MDVCDDGSPLSPVGGSSSFTFSPSSSDSVHGTPLTASSLASTSPITSGHYGSFPSSNGSIPPPSISAPPASHSRKVPPPPSLAIRRAGEQKKQTLACLFCRERKIACGRPAEGSPDPTCNQCARRCFKCEYPTESKRGQHKRSKKKVLAEKAPN
ncbi:hypothetical protein BDN72DRAFT_777883 [Pluteus cervinus]|uniref:Uncharacterized protein n=1 Tax=Pluteus cervinus TaxID=181527 RepID=A0ACD3A7U0_9AGAR|nr:hypothetical protein BDN72DRAFT_777883 [Pluteus cervinus]